MNEADLKQTHNECKHEVMTTIEDIQCLGSEEHKQKHIKKFEEEIEKMWEMKKMKNDLLKVNDAFCIFFKCCHCFFHKNNFLSFYQKFICISTAATANIQKMFYKLYVITLFS